MSKSQATVSLQCPAAWTSFLIYISAIASQIRNLRQLLLHSLPYSEILAEAAFLSGPLQYLTLCRTMQLEGEFAAYKPPLPTHTHLALLTGIVLSAFLFHIFFPQTAMGTCHSTPYSNPKKSIPIIEPHFHTFQNILSLDRHSNFALKWVFFISSFQQNCISWFLHLWKSLGREKGRTIYITICILTAFLKNSQTNT